MKRATLAKTTTTRDFQETLVRRRYIFGYTQRELAKIVGVKASLLRSISNAMRRKVLRVR